MEEESAMEERPMAERTQGEGDMAGITNIMSTRAKTILVEDHPLFRRGVHAVLSTMPELEIVGEASTALEALELAQQHTIEVAVVDLVLPGASGVSVASAIKRLHPACKILGLSMVEEPTRIAEMIRGGADGYALKNQTPAEIIEAVRTIRGGTRYLAPAVAADRVELLVSSDDAWPLMRLTQREREIFDLLVAGRSNDDIASQLFIARRTVETHRQHIMKKVGARSLVELIRIATKHGVATTCAI